MNFSKYNPILTDEKRKEMGKAAIRAAKAVNYENAGTIEFIYDLNENKSYKVAVLP
jgi:acetyl-CoA carboxylase biotin carboxylase subunit